MQTGDNVGVQSGEYILECKNKVGKDTKFITGTLDDFADEIYKCDLSGLKVIRGEMSDSWIHGAGTYPDAMSEYKRDLCKFKQMNEYARSVGADISQAEDEFYRAALIFAEHTFGINVLKFFEKERSYEKADLSFLRKNDAVYRLAEESWQEQKNYVKNLSAICQGTAEKLGYVPAKKVEAFLPFEIAVRNDKLDVFLLNREKITLSYEYIVFGTEDLHRFMKEYLVRYWEWSLSDFGRCLYPETDQKRYSAKVVSVEKVQSGYKVLLQPPRESFEKYGNFRNLKLDLSLTDSGLRISLEGADKDATAMVEAGNLHIDLNRHGKIYKVKQGSFSVDVDKDIVAESNHGLWAVNGRAEIDDTVLETPDAPLVSFGGNAICRYRNHRYKKTNAEFTVNLFNNHWGTNFPQWIEGNFRYEFFLKNKTK